VAAAMATHKFKPGQVVRIVPSQLNASARGSFTVLRILPTEHGINQYRVKSTVDGHERVVIESELD
jgi:hypothetical protein